MSRIIKFRVFNGKEMIYFDLPDYAFDQDGPQKIDLETMPLMQYVGVVDKNGVSIFEGDIAKITWSEVWGLKHPLGPKEYFYTDLGVMEFIQDSAQFGFLVKDALFDKEHDNITIEVIGNIYQNPELLKESLL